MSSANAVNKIRTFFRIQWRMFLIHAAEVYVVLEWPLRLIVNLVMVLTSPIWIGLVYLLAYVYRAYESKKNVERKVLLGKIWYWDQFKLY